MDAAGDRPHDARRVLRRSDHKLITIWISEDCRRAPVSLLWPVDERHAFLCQLLARRHHVIGDE